MTKIRREFILERYGDMREDAASLLMCFWLKLSLSLKNKMKFMIFNDIILLCQSRNFDLSLAGRNLLSDLLEAEFYVTKSCSKLEDMVIDSANSLAESSGLGYLVGILDQISEQLDLSTDEELKKEGYRFVNSVQEFYSYLSNLQKYKPTAANEIDRCFAALQLIDYLKKTKREGILLDNVIFLAKDIHEAIMNYVEAGMVLESLAHSLEWSDRILDGYNRRGKNYPRQTESERKEQLFNDAIEMYSRGKYFEKCISVIKILIQRNEEIILFQKLPSLSHQQAEMFANILNTERFFPTYFRVRFEGEIFGEEINGKEFIYRGAIEESLGAFMNRMKEAFVTATIIIDDRNEIKGLKNDSKENFVFIRTVRPVVIQKNDIPVQEKIATYRRSNDVNLFTYTVAKRKSTSKTDNEFRDLWNIKYFFKTESNFPSKIRCLRIIETNEEHINPILCAIENLKESYNSLKQSIQESSKKMDRSGDTAGLGRYLSGIIDAGVNGGVKKYIDAFLNSKYEQEFPEFVSFIPELKKELISLAELIPSGLIEHERIRSELMEPFQKVLETTFRDQWIGKMIKTVRESL
eukprot:c21962_g3_i1.p1 GENE.c21962_g3_i1~~c21962_g3_i1.p1  ORF type:complete len:579 (-),score=201.11 c21962_g3_i1:66-1802(-)